MTWCQLCDDFDSPGTMFPRLCSVHVAELRAVLAWRRRWIEDAPSLADRLAEIASSRTPDPAKGGA